MWVIGEWAVGHWIVGVMSFQKIYGLYGLKHHTVDLLSCRFLAPTNGLTNRGIPRGPRGPKKKKTYFRKQGGADQVHLHHL